MRGLRGDVSVAGGRGREGYCRRRRRRCTSWWKCSSGCCGGENVFVLVRPRGRRLLRRLPRRVRPLHPGVRPSPAPVTHSSIRQSVLEIAGIDDADLLYYR